MNTLIIQYKILNMLNFHQLKNKICKKFYKIEKIYLIANISKTKNL